MRQKKLVYYGKKCLIFLISVFILSVAVFYVARLAPGDPLISYYGDRTEKMSPEEREWAMGKLGLNEPISVQYVKWVKNAFHGEFGISFKYKQDVVEVIGGRIGNTLVLGGIGFIIMFAGALLLGILCAWYENRLADRILCKLGTISSCIPEFWMALVLILVFSVNLKILPSSGAYSTGNAGDIGDRVLHLIMPLTIVVMEHLWYYASSAVPISTILPAYMTATLSATRATTPRSWDTSMVAVPSFICISRRRSRICACIVTSSAVVGSSANKISGSAARAMAMTHL